MQGKHMLAATPNSDSRLELLSVVLRSVDDRACAEISAALKDQVYLILHTAAQITANPGAIDANTVPEAIELAFRIRSNPALAQSLSQLRAFDAIRPDIVKDILKSLRPVAA
jgi:hypothetical protein